MRRDWVPWTPGAKEAVAVPMAPQQTWLAASTWRRLPTQPTPTARIRPPLGAHLLAPTATRAAATATVAHRSARTAPVTPRPVRRRAPTGPIAEPTATADRRCAQAECARRPPVHRTATREAPAGKTVTVRRTSAVRRATRGHEGAIGLDGSHTDSRCELRARNLSPGHTSDQEEAVKHDVRHLTPATPS
jgi:hypothetical protein